MPTITRIAVLTWLSCAGTGFAVAQGPRTAFDCDGRWTGGDRRAVSVCEVREFTLAPSESFEINGRPNGSVRVTGWDRDEIEVKAEVRSWARDEEVARRRFDEIEIQTEGTLRATGPRIEQSWWPFARHNGGWTVNFEVMAPLDTDLWIETVNGGITVAAMRGRLEAETVNGGIRLTDVAAPTRGRTVNGGIAAELTGETIDGGTLDLRTTNGGIVIRIPEDFSARFDIATVNGGVRSDFPVTRTGFRNREVSGTLGSGRAVLRARTVNGGVQLRQL